MKEFKYIKNIEEGGEGVIHLYNQIGDFVDSDGRYQYGISGSAFAYEMKYLADRCTHINVRINSIGGSVLDGYSIVSAIITSKVPVFTFIDGLAASIAGVIAVCGKKCYMMDYGSMMLHNPSGGEDKKILALVKETLVTILSNRTDCTPEEIDEMMDKETWLNAVQAMEKGLVDEVVNSTKKIKIKKSETLANRLAIYNKLLNNINPQMKNLNKVLNLKEDASEEATVSAVETLNEENKNLKAENASMKEKLDALEKEKKDKEEAEKAALIADATALVNKAIADKKITEEEKAAVLANASSSRSAYEVMNKLFNKATAGTQAAKIFDPKNVKTATGSEDRSTWSIRDWEKNDPTGLMNLKNSEPETYKEMYDAFYKKK